MDVNYLEFTGQQDLPYVTYINGKTIVFTHVPSVNDSGEPFTTQVARFDNPAEYRWVLEHDPALRPFVPTVAAEKIIDAKELKEAEEAEERARQNALRAALVRVDTAQKRHLRILEEMEALMRQAGQKKLEAEETAKTLKEAEDYLASLSPEEPEEKAEKPAPKPRRKKQ